MCMTLCSRYVRELNEEGYEVECCMDWLADGIHIRVSKDGSHVESFMSNKYVFDVSADFILKDTLRRLVRMVDNERSKHGLS